MKFSWNVIAQAIATAIQGANAIGTILPHDHQVAIALGIGAVQAIVAFIAHFKNPDGTTAKVAWQPPQN